jgi:diguanylate cyclase (GGDEF)-like protein
VVCSVGSFALIALGFRRRAGLPLRMDAILAAAGVTVLFASMAVWHAKDADANRWLVALFCSAMLLVSTFSLRARGLDGRRATGGAAFWMLALFAAYTLGLGMLALVMPSGDQGVSAELYRLMFLMGVPTGLFGVGLFAMFLLAADLAEGMRRLAASDPLTNILNRRGFEQSAQPLVDDGRRRGRPLAVVIADIDRFKGVNDRFGHAVGDAVLQRFAEHVTATIRPDDLFGRLGGEEFVLLLPDTDSRQAMALMERVRAGLSDMVHDVLPPGSLTASFGVAVLENENGTLRELMQRADEALYQSKVGGRDRVTLAARTNLPVGRRWGAEPRQAIG